MADGGIQSFLPWVRQGMTSLPADPLVVTMPGGALTSVQLQVPGGAPIKQNVRLYGPGDVTAVDPRHIVRTEPADLTSNFESNFLAAVEFDRPDFPWLFTPASANANKLRPWVVLVVVRQQNGVNILGGSDRPLPVLEIKTPANAAAELPNLVESWAWAHAQITGQITAQLPLPQIETQFPERTISRLLCPRKLTPDTAYHACVVPAFQVGVKVGLGLQPTAQELATLQPAWVAGAASVQLPIYFRWQFRTGDAGDFSSLVQKLTVYEFPKGSGIRNMYVGAAGLRLPTAPPNSPDAIVGMESALVAPKTVPVAWTNTFSNQFRNALRALLDVSADTAADPVVGPPLYGGRHVNQVRPPADNVPPNWLRELNLHPGYRTVAGWGTRVVERQQEALMASAWEQVGEIERANNLLRHGQLVRAAAATVYQRHLSKLLPGPLLEVSRPVHARIAVAPQTTVMKLLASNNMPETVVSASFRKVARPRGPMLRSVLPAGQRSMRPIIGKLVDKSVVIGIPRPPVQTVTPELVEQRFQAAGNTRPAGSPVVGFLQMQSSNMAFVPPRPVFELRDPQFVAPPSPQLEFLFVAPDDPVAARYRAAITAHQALLGPSFVIFPLLNITLQLNTVPTMVLAQLHPDTSVSGFVRNLTKVGGQPAAAPDLEPIAAAPSFPQPMYAPLRDLAPDLVIPGVAQLPDNKIAILETNPRFIEAYMAGLNHEMARELLWRGYPTDQRGTYFRSFWDSSGRPAAFSTAAGLGDIPPIHTWPDAKHLGEIAAGGSGTLVLVVKAELLRRYANAIVYAVPAVLQPGQTKPKLGTTEVHPIFRGSFDPDITFFGFPLTLDQVRGTGTPTAPGHFFVIQEHPGAPRFGLAADAPPNTPLQPGAESASTARALLQRPVRFAIHARDLLKGLSS
jgi:hypothetical protein